MTEYFGKEVPKLGFGLMRLPKKGVGKDIEQFKEMVDMFLDAGFTYFDTAYIYGGSEAATKKALVERHPRDSYTLCSKLNSHLFKFTEIGSKRELVTSMNRAGVEYFDFYLLHALSERNYKKYEDYHLWDFLKERKAKGQIRHIGFSYHGGPELLDQLLTEHPEVELVQLQINYEDWENPKVFARANYEVARKHGKSIVIMEPVKGGSLADPPEEVKKLFKEYAPDMSYASWAIRFCASLDGVITVLSGMSNVEQMKDNISFMKDFKPLNEEEQEIIHKAQRIIGQSATIPCTACHYCTDGCPVQIDIPGIFKAMNKQLGSGQTEEAKEAYLAAAPEGRKASNCIECGQCEAACPQKLSVIEGLKKAAEMFE